ncbi:MAG: hypothetical protein ACR2HJ_01240 [Fimbriimonadales bacterium]
MKQAVIVTTLAAFGLIAGAGCRSRQPDYPAPLGDLTGDLKKEFAATAPAPPLAGTERDLRPYTKEQLIASANVPVRARYNPFALFPEEVTFQNSIRYDRILSNLPNAANSGLPYSLLVPAPVEPPPIELAEPEAQPYRRLSGIYFGETVTALIEMGGGKTYLVSPGDRVGETEWYVEAIDAEKVTLVRSGNKDPRRIFVRLESRPFFTPEPGGGGQGGGVGTGGSRGGGGLNPSGGGGPSPAGGG